MQRGLIIAILLLFIIVGSGGAAYFLILQPAAEGEHAAASNVTAEKVPKPKGEPPAKKRRTGTAATSLTRQTRNSQASCGKGTNIC